MVLMLLLLFSTWAEVETNLLWEEGDKYLGKPLEFDGVPFLVVATKELLCHYGIGTKKTTTDSSKNLSCPAKVVLKEVIKFPDYKPIAPVGILEECVGSAVQLLPISGAANFIYSDTHIRAHITTQIEGNAKCEKEKWSKILQDDICCGSVRSERRIYVYLPSPELHLHTVLTKRVVQDTKADVNGSVPHCLICNSKLSTSTRSAIPLFTGKDLPIQRPGSGVISSHL
ncbi:hypothetical protein E2C01_000845 [Portunus trituberculatus]|uniref:Uncharacterized protein n=1 Tax=Portunus trituberculatus TaxID=210409 RepID=A0A5B7CHP3_PORTR|nr:hypothetical protein [Portunus trituberculatus]